MINRASILLLLFSFSIAHAGNKPVSPKSSGNPLVGTWRLVSYADTPEGGKPNHAFGVAPIGQFIFTHDGHISVHIMHNPPAPKNAVVDLDPDACLPAWYCAYFGTYTFNSKDSSWVTRVTGGNVLTYIGTDQKRQFSIKDGKLVISETYMADGVKVTAERILIREK